MVSGTPANKIICAEVIANANFGNSIVIIEGNDNINITERTVEHINPNFVNIFNESLLLFLDSLGSK